MKIAQVSRGCFRYGGAGRVVYDLSGELVKLGHEVTVFANIYEEVPGARFVRVPMIEIKSLKKSGQGALAKIPELFTFGVLSRFYLNYNDFDVVHVHGDSFARFDLRTCHSVHRAWLEGTKAGAKGLKGWVRKNANPYHELVLALERFNLNRKDKYAVALSSQIGREIKDYYTIDRERIITIPNGVDLETFHPDKRSKEGGLIRQRHGIGEQERVLIFVGWEFGRKGLRCVLDAMASAERPSKLFVLGNDAAAPYRQRAEELGIGERVIFVGASTEVPAYMAAADIFVLPTLYEPFGLVITEAAASGTAIITSRLAGAADYFEDGRDALLLDDPLISRELSEKLNGLLEDDGLLEKMKQGARLAAEDLSWAKVAMMYDDLYRRIVAEKNR